MNPLHPDLLSQAALPWPAQPWAAEPPPARTLTTLEHCLLLAALLHVWLVLALGSAPAGTARPGQGVWGAINVTLLGADTGPAAGRPPQAPVLPTGPAGEAPSSRWGGTVRARRAAETELPGAARLGRWAPEPELAPPLPEVPQQAAREFPPSVATPEAVPPAAPPPSGRVLPERPAPPSPAAPLPTEVPAPEPESRLDSALVRPVARPTAAAPLQGMASLPGAALPGTLPSLTAPLAERPAPAVDRAPPAAPVLRQLGAAVPATPAPQPALPGEELLTAAPAPPGLPATRPLAARVASPAGPSAPDAGPQRGHDVATAPSVPASSPRLNLDLPRLRGGELSRYGTSGVLPVLPRPPELPDKLGREIEKTAKSDCRTAYGGLGLLAVVPLAVDAVRKDGCKW